MPGFQRAESGEDDEDANIPESRVLIIMTGGTICMDFVKDVGYVPTRGFLKKALGPRPSFNDGSYPEPLEIIPDSDWTPTATKANTTSNSRSTSGTSTPNPPPSPGPSTLSPSILTSTQPVPPPPRKAVHSLRTPPSIYARRIRYAVLEFATLLDSCSISAQGWTRIARTIHNNYALFDGFVILHGTDSLAYTSSALSFMLQNLGKPVVLTGAQLPMRQLQSDATDNLLGSLVIAGHFMIPEVCLFFANKLFRGNRATKVSASDFDAFASPNCAPLATIQSTRTQLSWDTVLRPSTLRPFSILRSNIDTAHVACLRIFPGIKPEMVEAVVKMPELKGLVLETFGAGNAPAAGGADCRLTAVLEEAIGKRGIVIVSVTQCLHGTVQQALYESGTALAKVGVVSGLDMTSEAALTKLAYLLALPELSGGRDGIGNTKHIAQLMATSLRGELTESAPTAFQHPLAHGQGGGGSDGNIINNVIGNSNGNDITRPALSMPAYLEPRVARLTKLGYAIGEGDLEGVKEILAFEGGRNECLVNDVDYSGNTPLHLATTSPNPNPLILRALLERGASVHLRNERAGSANYHGKNIYNSNNNNNNNSGNYNNSIDKYNSSSSVSNNDSSSNATQGHTPLFLAARAGLVEHVRLLREAGAHLHPEEWAEAKALAERVENGSSSGVDTGETEKRGGEDSETQQQKNIWRDAGMERV